MPAQPVKKSGAIEGKSTKIAGILDEVGPRLALTNPPYVNPGILGFWIRMKTWFFSIEHGFATCYMRMFFLKKKKNDF